MSPTAQSSRWRSKDAKVDKEQKDKRRKFSLSLQKQKKKKRTECNFARAGTVRGKKKTKQQKLPSEVLSSTYKPAGVSGRFDRDFGSGSREAANANAFD